ncbi:MAG TPA: DUF2336 domain-containing protein [Xanthobacteraceae bacterium]|jgi:uncharacterized protein (DUF2336 family)|nr:DUF2336 domain-containing protein [Xanthobacteraceae bacterium]
MSVHASLLPELDDLIIRGSPQRQAKILERVTRFFLDRARSFNDDHVQLFDLVFTRLIDRIETTARSELSSRLAPLGNAPVEAVRRLARDDSITVAAPVLKQADGLSETDLIDITQTKSQAHLFAISARPGLAEPVTDGLVQRGNQEVLRSLAGNRAARLSDEAFCLLVERAKTDGILAEKIVLRGDIPPRLFHELLLTATDAVQRRLLASVGPDGQAEIRHTSARECNPASARAAPADYSRAQRRITALQHEGKLDEALLVGLAESADYDHTIAALASLCVVPIEVVDRLMRAERPDPVLILCKSAGWGWATAEAIIKRRPGSAAISGQDLGTARADFDLLSPTSAQRVIRFWQVRSDGKRRTTGASRG